VQKKGALFDARTGTTRIECLPSCTNHNSKTERRELFILPFETPCTKLKRLCLNRDTIFATVFTKLVVINPHKKHFINQKAYQLERKEPVTRNATGSLGPSPSHLADSFFSKEKTVQLTFDRIKRAIEPDPPRTSSESTTEQKDDVLQ
jgi:hypothetical protein